MPTRPDDDETILDGTVIDGTVLDVGTGAIQLEGGPSPEGGEAFGRYAGARVIARGGMGAILEAIDPQLGRPVAIKVILSGAEASPQALDRFLREARITGQLVHPNIPPLHELGQTADGRPYFVMKLVDGRSLADVLAGLRERRDHGQRRRLLADLVKVCDALAYAHSRGVVHRDLKPDNLLIGAFGEVLVMDWGIARVLGAPDDGSAAIPVDLGQSSGRTLDGSIIGTPAYMSPEQATGDVARIDGRSDVYSLGAIVYEILTLEPAFGGRDTHRLLGEVARGLAEPPSARAPDAGIPAELDALVLKAMDRRPDGRYPSIEALKEDIERHLSGHALVAARYSALQRLAKWVGRNRALSAFLAAVAILVPLLAVSLALALRSAAAEARARAESDRQAEEIAGRDRRNGDYLLRADYADEADRLQAPYPERIAAMEAWLAGVDRLLERRDVHRADLAAMEAAGADDQEAAWSLGRQRELVEGLERLETTRRDVVERMAEAGRWPARMAAHAESWRRAGPAIRARYGIDLPVLTGLVPIGEDPSSGLHEFWHIESGERPSRGADGHLLTTLEQGLVLVLIPAGRFRMGDAAARDEDVRPVHEVTFEDPFLISKYEMTQAQWRRLAGTHPSRLTSAANPSLDERHPVENVTWFECRDLLRRHGLDLPSESSWEYACRAGRSEPWSTGADEASLERAANLADRSFERATRQAAAVAWNDGFPVHGPVGSLAANGFGLHDVHGNVFEWCRDSYHVDYHGAPVDGSAWIVEGAASRVYRGGSWMSPPLLARSAVRLHYAPHVRYNDLGVRPARPLSFGGDGP